VPHIVKVFMWRPRACTNAFSTKTNLFVRKSHRTLFVHYVDS
jgi:hypothetical protein